VKRLAEVDLLAGDLPVETRFPRSRLIEARPDEPAVDWQLVVVLRRRASEQITAAIAEHSGPLTDVDRRLLGRAIVRTVVREHVDGLSDRGQALWPMAVELAYAHAVENAIFGYGRLQPLFEIEQAENIEIHGCDSVVVQYSDGRRETRPPVADSDAELVEATGSGCTRSGSDSATGRA
jgi:hypothetical protein